MLDRPFDVVTDRGQLGSGFAFVRDSLGPWAARGGAAAAVALVGAAVVVPAAGRSAAWRRWSRRHRARSARVVVAVARRLGRLRALRAPGRTGGPRRGRRRGPFVAGKGAGRDGGLPRPAGVRHALAADPFRDPGTGRPVRPERARTSSSPSSRATAASPSRGPSRGACERLLDGGTDRLSALGLHGASALAHLPDLRRQQLAGALHAAVGADDRGPEGGTTGCSRARAHDAHLGLRPGRAAHGGRAALDARDWPEGQAFYRFDRVYDRSGLGYAGPRFGFSAMPDQFALAAFDRLELRGPAPRAGHGGGRATSSHGPWAPLPTTVEPAALGDGSVFDGIEADAVTAAELWSDRPRCPAAYRASIAYSLTSLLAFVERGTRTTTSCS